MVFAIVALGYRRFERAFAPPYGQPFCRSTAALVEKHFTGENFSQDELGKYPYFSEFEVESAGLGDRRDMTRPRQRALREQIVTFRSGRRTPETRMPLSYTCVSSPTEPLVVRAQ